MAHPATRCTQSSGSSGRTTNGSGRSGGGPCATTLRCAPRMAAMVTNGEASRRARKRLEVSQNSLQGVHGEGR